jgi:hypothetical protein
MLVSRRYERASLIVTSHKPFSAWGPASAAPARPKPEHVDVDEAPLLIKPGAAPNTLLQDRKLLAGTDCELAIAATRASPVPS